MRPGITAADYWREMDPKARADWLWHRKYGDPITETWAEDELRLVARADPESSVAFRQLSAVEDHPDGPSARRVRLTQASSIKPRPVQWLWDGRIALGTLGLLAGREGIGKSTLGYTLAAEITRGRLSGNHLGQPWAVIVAATEDSWEHTIVPRLMAAQADLDLILRVDVTEMEGFDSDLVLPSDLAVLEEAVVEVGAAMILLDPLISRLSAGLDTHKDAEVRRALEPLVALADRSHAAVLGVIHVNKTGGGDALNMVMGSRAFSAVARSVLFAMSSPDDEDVKLLGQPKNNLGRGDLPTMTYRIVGEKVADTEDGPIWTGKVKSLGESTQSITDALASSGEDLNARSAIQDAAEWLSDFLASVGGGATSAACKAAGKAVGHSERTLGRARVSLHLITESQGFPRVTYWMLPNGKTTS